jgi:hypothetical protein
MNPRTCPHCAGQIPEDSIFCAYCGVALPPLAGRAFEGRPSTVAARAPPTAAAIRGHSPDPPPPYSTGYWTESETPAPWPPLGTTPTAPILPPDDVEVRRTITGLLLSAIGFSLAWIPEIGILGGLIVFVGLIYLFLGREAFDDTHRRLVVVGGALFVISGIIAGVEFLSFAASIAQSASQPGETPAQFIDTLTGQFQSYFLVVLFASVLGALGQALVIFRIADAPTKGILGIAVASGLAISILIYESLAPQITTVFQEATNGTTYNPAPIDALLNQIQLLSALRIVPDLLFAYAYWRTRTRVMDGDVARLQPPTSYF